jgi:hypothetical protein
MVLLALALVGGAIGVTQGNSGEVIVGLGVAIVAAAVLIVLFGAAPNDDGHN